MREGGKERERELFIK